MIKKLALIALSAVLLGGCTLSTALKTDNAATDAQPTPTPATTMATPTPMASQDTSLEAMPSTSTSTDVDSLESDINNTKVLDEDFSDLN